MSQEQSEGLLFSTYQINITNIQKDTDDQQIKQFIKGIVSYPQQISITRQQPDTLVATFLVELNQLQFSRFQTQYLRKGEVQTVLGNIEFNATKIVQQKSSKISSRFLYQLVTILIVIFIIIIFSLSISNNQAAQTKESPINKEGPFWKLETQPPFEKYIDSLQDFFARQNARNIYIVKESSLFSEESESKLHSRIINWKELNSREQKSSEWAHCQEPSKTHIRKNLQQLSKVVSKGVIFSWKTKSEYFTQWVEPFQKNHYFKLFEENGLFYDEMLSLNLRSPTGQFFIIFRKQKIQSKRPLQFSGVKTSNYVAIQTVFRMQENLAYLREWLGYHLHLGVDKFILYNNYGSVGQKRPDRSTSSRTKYKMNLTCFGFDKETLKKQFDQIWRDYDKHLIYIPWQARKPTGEIYYGQDQSFIHYQYYFEDLSIFTAFIDVDEFLFSPTGLILEDFLKEKNHQGFNLIRTTMTKFSNRFCFDRRLATDIDTYLPAKTQQWAPKSIIYMKAMSPGQNVHSHKIKFGQKYFSPQQQLRFNHYNNIIGNFEGAKKNHWTTDPVFAETDTSMDRYKNIIENQICSQGSCSQNYQFKCPKLKCMEIGVPY